MNWRKSSYSGNGGGSCVEVADDSGIVVVRDTTNRDGGSLTFSGLAWSRFVTGL
jgi:hypothetical protein